MSIKEFDNNDKLLDIRTLNLNPAIRKVNELDAKVEGLQLVTALAMTNPRVDADTNKIIYKVGNTTQKELDLTPMLTKFQHGVDVKDDKGHSFTEIHSLKFTGGAGISASGADVEINMPGVDGQVGSTVGQLKKVQVIGETAGSTFDTGTGVMQIHIPTGGGAGTTIEGEVEGVAGPQSITHIKVSGNVTTSTVDGGELDIVIPAEKPLLGRVQSGDAYGDVQRLTLQGNKGTSGVSGGDMVIDLPFTTGQVGDTPAQNIHKVKVTGKVENSKVDSDILEVNIPFGVGVKEVGKPAVPDVSEITFANSTVSVSTSAGGNKVLVTPGGMKGQIDAGQPERPIQVVQVKGNRGASHIDPNGEMVIDIPFLKGRVDGTTDQDVSRISIVGSKTGTSIDNGTLTLNIPTGGGGGPGGSITGVVGTESGEFTELEVTGDITGSSVKDGKLTIDLPHASGISIAEEGGAQVTAVELVQFKNATVTSAGTIGGKHAATVDLVPFKIKHTEATVDANPIKEIDIKGYDKGNTVSGGIATINIPDVQGEFEGVTDSLTKVKIIGNKGATTFHNGELTIDLPTGGSGPGPGGAIKGQVGGDISDITKVKVVGNTKLSKVDGPNQVLEVGVPDKPKFTDGAKTEVDIDVVQVAHSTLEVTEDKGVRTALITPIVNQFFQGWFQSMGALNTSIAEKDRIITKTSAYVMNPALNQTELWVWMPDITGSNSGQPLWVKTKIAAAIEMFDNGQPRAPICSVAKNNMTEVDSDGKLIIRDTTIPNIPLDIMDESGTAIIQKGHANLLKFEDGEGYVDFNSTSNELTFHRAQRRVTMGDSPDQTAPEYKVPHLMGSIFYNKTDDCWWGYSDKDKSVGAKKWTRVLHPEISGQVESLARRVPQIIPTVEDVEIDVSTGDCKQWAESGWTHIDKDSKAMPAHIRGRTGGYVETFVIEDATALGGHHRYQLLHVETDAATYKRYWRFEGTHAGTWSEWVKTSFNPSELQEHNDDPSAHRKTHPFFKVLTFSAKYSDVAAGGFWVDHENFKVLGSSNGIHQNSGSIVTVPYDGKFQLRGHIYFHGNAVATSNPLIAGRWRIYIDRKKKGESNWSSIYEGEYLHNSTSLAYPPLKWDADNMDLKEGDELKLGFNFNPNTGSHTDWLKLFPSLGFRHLRSYFAIDEKGNDGGSGLGEMYRTVIGNFTSLGDAGVIAFNTGTSASPNIRVVGEQVDGFIQDFGTLPSP